ncbi:MAG: rhodanese-like domain-containing protein [Slackia sp.]|nr:rhodanese-like domain-containing protein [Slackia sp.]
MKLDAAEVQEMLAGDPHMLLVDVRTQEEYDTGHIAGAGCMPVEDICDCLYDEALAERGLDAIANARGMELSDDASVIVLYCETGEKSAQAVQHMEALGYVNVYDAGGLIDWPFDVVTTDEERAVAAALAASANVAQETAPAASGCACGHDHDHGDSCCC